MSYTYLQEQGAESSAECFSDIPAFVLWRLNLTADSYSSKDSETAFYRVSRSGMTLEHLTVALGEDWWTLFVEDSRAQTSPCVKKEQKELLEKKAGYGNTCAESWARFDPESSLWRTRQCLLLGGLEPFLETYPGWGSMRNGELLERAMPAQITNDYVSGFWLPTPCKSDANGSGRLHPQKSRDGGRSNLKDYMSGVFKWLYPPVNIVEWLMGWPEGWTDLAPLGTDKFQQWLDSHGTP